MHTLVFHNPKAGNGKADKVCRAVQSELKRLELSYCLAEHENDVAVALALSPARVIAIGGDGTFNFLLNRIDPGNCILLPVSGGTGNDLVRTIHHPPKPLEQLHAALFTEPRFMDIWEVNERRFLAGCGIGFDGIVAQAAVNAWTGFPSGMRYSLAVARHLFTAKKFQCAVLTENQLAYEGPLFMLSAGNGQFAGGGFKLWPAANATDGLLDVVMISKADMVQRLLYAAMVRKGQHLALPGIQYLQVKELHVHADRRLLMHADGEPGHDRNFTLRHAGHLRVLCAGASLAARSGLS